MAHRKHKHHNIYQGQLIFNPFPEELRQLRESMRAELRKTNEHKRKVLESARNAEDWEDIKRACKSL